MNRLGPACLLCALAVWPGCVPRKPPPVSRRSPVAQASLARPSSYEYFIYAVRPGDSLYQLQQRFGVPWEEIRDANELNPEDLKAGSLLVIRRVDGFRPAQGRGAPSIGRPLDPRELHRGQPGARYWWPTRGRPARRYGQALQGLPDPGIAIPAPAGTPVCAVADGTVTVVVPVDCSAGSAWGNVVVLSHANRVVSWYGHLAGIQVRPGQKVAKGEPLGTVGSSGAAARPMLAFRLFRDERPLNPEHHLP